MIVLRAQEYNGVAVGGGYIHIRKKKKEMEVKTPACHYTQYGGCLYTVGTHTHTHTHAYIQ
jgi:hypothetical protein